MMSLMANPIDVEHYLEHTSFPAGKEDLLAFARSNHAGESIIASLETLPRRQYASAEEAAKATWIPRDSDSAQSMGADSPDDY
jgi:hypothetical protein